MSTPAAFVLPLKGLGKGRYDYELHVDDAFFTDFPESPLDRAAVDLRLSVEKEARQMVIDVDLNGTVRTACDRCLADIDLPIANRDQVIVKFTEESEGQQDEGEIVYLHPDTYEFNLAPLVYEMIAVAVPMIRVYACREGAPPYPCDEDLLQRIGEAEAADSSDEGAASDDQPSPWDVLKNLNNN